MGANIVQIVHMAVVKAAHYEIAAAVYCFKLLLRMRVKIGLRLLLAAYAGKKAAYHNRRLSMGTSLIHGGNVCVLYPKGHSG